MKALLVVLLLAGGCFSEPTRPATGDAGPRDGGEDPSDSDIDASNDCANGELYKTPVRATFTGGAGGAVQNHALSPDGTVLVFSRSISQAPKGLFYSMVNGDTLSTPVEIPVINQTQNEDFPFWSYDGTVLYYRREGDGTNPTQMFQVGYFNGTWGTASSASDLPSIQKLDSARFSQDGLELYFSNLNDIYRAHRPSTGMPWETAKPMVSAANSQDGNERHPAVSIDGKELFFDTENTLTQDQDIGRVTRTDTTTNSWAAKTIVLAGFHAPDVSATTGRIYMSKFGTNSAEQLYYADRCP